MKKIEGSIKFKFESGHPNPDQVPHYYINNELILTDLKRKLINDAEDCFRIIYSSLHSYYEGNLHMFKPIAGQLRILFCDRSKKAKKDNSILYRIHPDIRLLKFEKPEINTTDEVDFISPPFSIIEKNNGIQTANIFISSPIEYLPLDEWVNQIIDIEPVLNIFDVVKAVADKGGGAHIDNIDGINLRAMKRKGPNKLGLHILFIIALAKFSLRLGNHIIPFWKSKLQSNLSSDP